MEIEYCIRVAIDRVTLYVKLYSRPAKAFMHAMFVHVCHCGGDITNQHNLAPNLCTTYKNAFISLMDTTNHMALCCQ